MDLVQSQTQSYSDESLCRLAASGDPLAETELVGRYTRLVRVCARPLFLAGGDSEDLIQEGMLGLLAAIRGFQSGKETSFRTYAEICVRSRLYAAVRAAQRDKHFPLNHSVSFETPLFDGTSAHLFSSEESPEDVVIGGRTERAPRRSEGTIIRFRGRNPILLSGRSLLRRDRQPGRALH